MTKNDEAPNRNRGDDAKRPDTRKPDTSRTESTREPTGKPAPQTPTRGADPRGPRFDDRPEGGGSGGRFTDRPQREPGQSGAPQPPVGPPNFGDTEENDPRHVETDAGGRKASRGDSGKTNQAAESDEE
jgi:hypothetical protein